MFKKLNKYFGEKEKDNEWLAKALKRPHYLIKAAESRPFNMNNLKPLTDKEMKAYEKSRSPLTDKDHKLINAFLAAKKEELK